MEPVVLILLAEDEPVIAMAVQDDLEEAGFAVHIASNGGQALAALEGGVVVSGLVTDIRLGEAPDGWEVARYAREITPTILVVYTSGDSAHEHSAYGVPDSIMLQKPFVGAQLITALTGLLNAVPPKPSK